MATNLKKLLNDNKEILQRKGIVFIGTTIGLLVTSTVLEKLTQKSSTVIIINNEPQPEVIPVEDVPTAEENA